MVGKRKRAIEQTIFIMFALVIFIVVSVVLLQMFLRGTGSVEEFSKKISSQEAIRECENYAISDKVKYCTAIYSIDLNGDKKYTDVPYEGKGNMIVCESSLHCYHLTDYISGNACLLEMCNYYIINNRLTPEEATIKVFGKYVSPLNINIKYTDVLSTANELTNQMVLMERYKDIKNRGIIFLGSNCRQDEILLVSLRQLFVDILNKAFNKSLPEINLIVDTDGVLYINSTNLRSDVQAVLASLYYGSVPNKVPLCAVLYTIR